MRWATMSIVVAYPIDRSREMGSCATTLARGDPFPAQSVSPGAAAPSSPESGVTPMDPATADR